MKQLILILAFIFLPGITNAFTASDFIVNRQSAYAVPPGSLNVLILDLTLPQSLQSIKINNRGTAQQYHISKLYIYEDGPSPGWDGDEDKKFTKSSSPFFDTIMASDAFSQISGSRRIFVTVDIASDAGSERTIQPRLDAGSIVFSNGETGPADAAILGFERMILAGTGLPQAPVAPIAQTPEALSTSIIRWHFEDRSNNEFGFKILDGNSNEVARNETADISYIDEIDLQPDTEYSGRRIIAFNDRGESLGSTASIFPAVYTLSLPPIIEETPVEEIPVEETPVEEAPVEKVPEEVIKEKPITEMTADEIKVKITELQQQIIELLNQLIQLLQEQLANV